LVVLFYVLISFVASDDIIAQGINKPTVARYEGLTSSSSWGQNPMVKDHLGRYWIATMDGLNIFDGYSFTTLRVEQGDKHSIVNNSLTTIAKSPNGNIWIGTANDGIFYYDIRTENFIKVDISKFKPYGVEIIQVNGLDIDEEGNVLVVPPFKGVYKLSLKDSTITKLDFNPQENLTVRNHYGVQVLGDGVMCIQADNGLFIGNESIGFEYFEYPEKTYSSRFFKLKNGNLVIPTLYYKGIYLFDIKTKIYKLIDSEIKPTGLSEYIDDHLYVSDPTGVYRFDPQKDSLIFLTEEAYNLHGGLRDIKGNLLAMGNNKDLIRIDLHNSKIGLVNLNGTSSIKSIDNKTIYYGSGAKYYAYDTQNNKERLIIDLKEYGDYIQTFHLHEDGTFYINLQKQESGEYLLVHLSQNGKVIKVLNKVAWYYFMINIDGKIGVNAEIRNPKKQEYKLVYPGDYVSDITSKPYNFFNVKNAMVRQNGELWIARYNNGIDIVSPERDSVYLLQSNDEAALFYGNNVNSLFESNRGNIYIQTEIGVNEFNPNNKKSILINQKNGLNDYNILRIGEDRSGNIWLVTKSHLISWNPTNQKLSKYSYPATYSPINIDEKDMFLDHAGALYFGSIQGIVKFHPDSMSVIEETNDIHITNLYVNRKSVFPNDKYQILDSSIVLQKEFDLTYEYRDLGFSFITVDGSLDNQQYYYRLDGYTDKWQLADETRTVHYTNLNEGSYTFEVKTKLGDGSWSGHTVSKDFYISPPWIRSIWAYLLYAISLFGALYMFYQYRVKQLTKYQRLRTKISSDLHDDVGTLLSSVAMQSEVLGLSAKEEDVERFDKLSNLSREAMGRMRDTVWAIDSRKDNVDSLVDRMEDYIADMNAGAALKVTFNTKIAKLSTKLPPDVRQNVYLIFKEAVNNAFKYSNGDALDIQLNHTSSQLEMTIHDNGDVDPSKVKTSGTGMSNMKMRAERINGELIINWDNGFRVWLKV